MENKPKELTDWQVKRYVAIAVIFNTFFDFTEKNKKDRIF